MPKTEASGETRPRLSSKDASKVDSEETRGEEKTGEEEKTIYMEGIPYAATLDDIRAFFDGCGTIVDIRAPKYQDSGRLRGYAHVEFASKSHVKKALEKDGAYLGGRFINVALAKPESAGKDAAMAFSARPRPGGCTTLFVKGLPYETNEDEVKTAFERFGNVVSVRLARWNHTSRLKGFGYVQFENGYSAEAAMKAYRSAYAKDESAKSGDVKEPVRISGRTIHMDYETAAPRQSFKTATGASFYKTEEAEHVKAQARRVARRESKKADAGAGAASDGDEPARPRVKKARREEED